MSFFVLSKIFWFVARPLNLLIFALALGTVISGGRLARIGRAITLVSFSLIALIGLTRLPDVLIHQMETVVEATPVPADIAGIIVLGGGLSANAQAGPGGFHMGEASDRLVTGLALLREHSGARLIYSGGVAGIAGAGEPEADAAMRLVSALFGDTVRIELESRSRNTFENAAFVREMTDPADTRPWLLVTSAFHMPRALGCFQAAGMEVLPVPTDYRADPIRFPWLAADIAGQFLKINLLVKELIGLAAYRLTGRIDTLLPR